jgi:hypothetical protein
MSRKGKIEHSVKCTVRFGSVLGLTEKTELKKQVKYYAKKRTNCANSTRQLAPQGPHLHWTRQPDGLLAFAVAYWLLPSMPLRSTVSSCLRPESSERWTCGRDSASAREIVQGTGQWSGPSGRWRGATAWNALGLKQNSNMMGSKFGFFLFKPD